MKIEFLKETFQNVTVRTWEIENKVSKCFLEDDSKETWKTEICNIVDMFFLVLKRDF